MIGIYKITNKVNGHCYVGQSRYIEKRWSNHIVASHNKNDKGYEYPLYRAIRKYGLENFDFSVIEECTIDQLNEREVFWIKEYSPEYNQTIGGDYKVIPQKLTEQQVKEIQQLLIDDVSGKLSHKTLAEKYGVHKDTIRDINVGRTWFDESLTYPLHYSQFDGSKPTEQKRAFQKFYCPDCGAEISRGAIRCRACQSKRQITEKPVSREELKNLIRTTPFTTIGSMFGVTDNTIRKWCDRYNLPRKVKDIKQYTDAEWALI